MDFPKPNPRVYSPKRNSGTAWTNVFWEAKPRGSKYLLRRYTPKSHPHDAVIFCSPAKSLTFSGLMENPSVGKKLFSPNSQAKCTKDEVLGLDPLGKGSRSIPRCNPRSSPQSPSPKRPRYARCPSRMGIGVFVCSGRVSHGEPIGGVASLCCFSFFFFGGGGILWLLFFWGEVKGNPRDPHLLCFFCRWGYLNFDKPVRAPADLCWGWGKG